MAQINKLKKGERVNRLAALDAMLELAKLGASQEQLALLLAIDDVYNQYYAADPLNQGDLKGLERRKKLTQLAILNGDYQKESARYISPTKSIFNNYGTHDLNDISLGLNAIALRTPTSTKATIPVSNETSSSDATPFGTSSTTSYYIYNPLNKYSTAWVTPLSTTDEKLRYFLSTISQNLKDFETNSMGKTLSGISESSRAAVSQTRSLIDSMLESKEPIDANQVKTILQNSDVFRDQNGIATAFRTLLPELFKEPTQAETNKKKLDTDQYLFITNTGNAKLDEYIKNNKLHAAQKDGINYLFDSEYNPYTGTTTYINDDWQLTPEQGYGLGYVIKNGQYLAGNLRDLIQEGNPYYEQYTEYLKKLQDANYLRFKLAQQVWNSSNSLSKKDLINHFSNDLTGHNIIDVGRYFDGTNGVIAIVDDDNADNHLTAEKHLNLADPSITFFYQKPDGTYDSTKDYRQVGNLTLHSDEPEQGYNNFIGFDFSNFGDYEGNDNVNMTNGFVNFFTPNHDGTLDAYVNQHNLNDLIPNSWKFDLDHNISRNTVATAVLWLSLYGDETASRQMGIDYDRLWRENKLKTIKFISDVLTLNPQILSSHPELAGQWQKILMTTETEFPNTVTKYLKDGGVIKAAWGTAIRLGEELPTADPNESVYNKNAVGAANIQARENALLARAMENGVSTKVQSARELSWTASDTLRATALGTDILATVAAISGVATGGFGNIAAGGLGLTSMGIDLAADLADKSVTKGLAAKNAIVNTGLAALGMLPGGGTAKITKTALKLVPRVVGYLGAAYTAMDPEIHKSVDKLLKQGSGVGKMTTRDWLNIGYLLRAVNGVSRGVATKVGSVKNTRAYNKAVQNKLTSIPSEVNENIVYLQGKGQKTVAFDKTKATKADINAALKEGASEEVINKAKNAFVEGSLEDLETKQTGNWWLRLRGKGTYEVLETQGPDNWRRAVAVSLVLADENKRVNLLLRNSAWLRTLHAADNVFGGRAYSPIQAQAVGEFGLNPTFRERWQQRLNPTRKLSTSKLLTELANKEPEFHPTITQEQLNQLRTDAETRRNAALTAADEQYARNINDSESRYNQNLSDSENKFNARHASLRQELLDTGAKNKRISKINNELAQLRQQQVEISNDIQNFTGKQNTRSSSWRTLLKRLLEVKDKIQTAADEATNLGAMYDVTTGKYAHLRPNATTRATWITEKRNQVQRKEKLKAAHEKEKVRLEDLRQQAKTKAEQAFNTEINNGVKGDRVISRKEVTAYRNNGTGKTDKLLLRNADVTFMNDISRAQVNKNLPAGARRLDPKDFKAYVGEEIKLRGAAVYTDAGGLHVLLWQKGGLLDRFHNYKNSKK